MTISTCCTAQQVQRLMQTSAIIYWSTLLTSKKLQFSSRHFLAEIFAALQTNIVFVKVLCYFLLKAYLLFGQLIQFFSKMLFRTNHQFQKIFYVIQHLLYFHFVPNIFAVFNSGRFKFHSLAFLYSSPYGHSSFVFDIAIQMYNVCYGQMGKIILGMTGKKLFLFIYPRSKN